MQKSNAVLNMITDVMITLLLLLGLMALAIFFGWVNHTLPFTPIQHILSFGVFLVMALGPIKGIIETWER